MNNSLCIKAQRIKLIVLFCCAILVIKGQQNFIQNYSFEDTLWCQPIGNTDVAKFKYWYNPTWNTPDAYPICSNPILINLYKPRTGAAQVGAFYYAPLHVGDQFEYIANKLKDTLYQGQKYCVAFYLKISIQFQMGTNNVGVFFKDTTINDPTFYLTAEIPELTMPLTDLVNDTAIWYKFKQTYVASGNESDVMFGSYMPSISANNPVLFPTNQVAETYLFLDDFSIVPTEITLGRDTTLCSESDSLLLGESNWIETSYKWFANGILIDTVNGKIKVKPNTTTTYIIQKQTSCTTTSDTIIVSNSGACPVLPANITEPVIPNVFSPNGDDTNEFWRITLPSGTKLEQLEVYNRWGNVVFSSEGTIKPWFGRTTSGEQCHEGVYFYILNYLDVNGELQKKNGYISLFR